MNNDKARNLTTTVHNFFATQSNPDGDEAIRIDSLFANFVAEHNLAFNIADHFTKLIKQIFPKVPSAQKFHCGRTNTTQIIKRALAPVLHDEVVGNLKKKLLRLAIE